MTADPPPPASIILSPAQCAALNADRADGSDHVALVAGHADQLNLDALTEALMELRRRHIVLRTTVRYTGDGPIGAVGTQIVVPVELLAGRPGRSADSFPPRRFDLARGPLVHVALSADDDGRTFLGFQAHAAALDEETARRAVRELSLLYRYFANGGPMPAATRGGYHQEAAGVRSAVGRVPRRMPAASHEIDPVIADRLRLVASSRGLPVALLVLAAWIAADGADGADGADAAPRGAPLSVAASLPDRSGRRPLGPACDRVLLRAAAGSGCDLLALAEHLHPQTVGADLDDGGTPVTFTFDDDRSEAGPGPFEVVESGTMLAPSVVSLAAYGTSAGGWRLRLVHRAAVAASATLARTAALLAEAGAALVEEELI